MNFQLAGTYFKPLSSTGTEAKITLTSNGDIHVDIGTIRELSTRVESVQNKRSIFLHGGSYFELDQPLTDSQLVAFESKLQSRIRWLEDFSLGKTVVLIAISVLLLALYRFGFTLITPVLASAVPTSWEQQIGQNVYAQMVDDEGYFTESNLSADHQQRLLRQAQVLIEASGAQYDIDIYFHDSPKLGANAFALPGGPIVVTDQLVELLEQDRLVVAVIAHEIAHVIHRHSLQQIVNIIGATAMVSVLFGGADSFTTEALLIGVQIWSLNGSRDKEQEADLTGFDILQAAGLPKEDMLDAVRLLLASECPDDCPDDALTWLSTHPAPRERLRYIELELDNK